MNKKMWSLYRDSENGKKIIEMFNSEVDDAYSGVEGLFEYAKKWGSMVEPKHASTWSFMFYANFTANNQLGEENPTRDDFGKFVETFEIVESEMDDDGNISFYNDAKAVWIKKNDYRMQPQLCRLCQRQQAEVGQERQHLRAARLPVLLRPGNAERHRREGGRGDSQHGSHDAEKLAQAGTHRAD